MFTGKGLISERVKPSKNINNPHRKIDYMKIAQARTELIEN